MCEARLWGQAGQTSCLEAVSQSQLWTGGADQSKRTAVLGRITKNRDQKKDGEVGGRGFSSRKLWTTVELLVGGESMGRTAR